MKLNPSSGPAQPRLDRAGAMRLAGLRGHFTSDSLDEIPALWGRLALRQWLPTSGFEMGRSTAGEPYALERYGEKFDPVTGTGDIEIWIPIGRR